MEIDLLVAKPESDPLLTEAYLFHPQYMGIKSNRFVYIGDSEDEMVEMTDMHRIATFSCAPYGLPSSP